LRRQDADRLADRAWAARHKRPAQNAARISPCAPAVERTVAGIGDRRDLHVDTL